MKALKDWSEATDPDFLDRKIIAFDLDDTLTSRGVLPASVHLALEEAQKRSWITVLVTGRPAGWADAILKLLPFDAVLSENGACIFYWPRGKAARLEFEESHKVFWSNKSYGAELPSGLKAKHKEAAESILKAHPRARIASDQAYRLYDLAIDFAEEVEPPLSLQEAEKIRELFTSMGATAKVSSIHVNGWWGSFNKESALRELVEKIWGLSLKRNLIYVGDSPNDGPLFKSAGLSVGVANVLRFKDTKHFDLPLYICQSESSQGALEILSKLLRP